MGDGIDRVLIDVLVRADAGGGSAVLAGVVRGAKGERVRLRLNVRMREDESGGLAAEFEVKALDAARCCSHHRLTCAGGAGEGDHRGVRVSDERSANIVAAHRGAEGRSEARGGIDFSGPLVGEAQAIELREGCVELRGEKPVALVAVLQARVCVVSTMVDGVVSTPQDLVVRGAALVMELVADIRQALVLTPTDRIEMGWRERLGGQHVIVDRQHRIAKPLEQRGEAVGCQRDFSCIDGHDRGVNCDACIVGGLVERDGLGVLVDAHAAFERSGFESP